MRQSALGPCQAKLPRDTTQTITPDDEENNSFTVTAFSILVDDQDMLEYFLKNYPAAKVKHPFALNYEYIAHAQDQDTVLIESLASQPTK